MRLLRKYFLMAAMILMSTGALAQSFPSKPIKIYVGYAPGGAVDLVARTLGQSMTDFLGQSIVVENKPGAGTNIATKLTIDSPPDGYTLMLAANALAANMALYKPQPYNAETDVAPIALVGRVPVVLVTTPDGKYKTLKDLILAAKARPDEITFGSPGNGATPHMAVKFFEQAAGISLKHIPYKGGSPAITDLIGGQLDLVAVNMLEAAPQVKSGNLRIIAVMSAKRSPLFPEVPTIAESGFPKFEAFVWYGLIAPAKTPTAVLDKLHSTVEKSLATKSMQERLTSVGGEVTPGTRQQFADYIKSEYKRYDKLVRDANIQPD
ncbi:tripartite tricarboxylate transporter substrate binding protein [Polynucleobacter sp. AP-Melu-500A-A1]|uniref:Bug family tripartite tricarboxylate transporter substrate binding protein n=1 Tax=Polynucleobacter sp. AP-Melu-500A-A1 TaxID=2576929 RepID=UPI0021066F64|nr:tripartite tricarboxylate transporter substrate binding protein [Polynucleobacter sp. AP-Melu-500A-A1]